jgi:hypothetical protein
VSDVRFFTPDEARAAVPRLKPLLAELRDAFHEYRSAREQVDDLVAMEGAKADDAELARWHKAAATADARVRGVLERIGDLGADVKDPILGLVDFYHKRKDGEVVLLCYRDDEDTIRYWHPLATGFAGRRPLAEL